MTPVNGGDVDCHSACVDAAGGHFENRLGL